MLAETDTCCGRRLRLRMHFFVSGGGAKCTQMAEAGTNPLRGPYPGPCRGPETASTPPAETSSTEQACPTAFSSTRRSLPSMTFLSRPMCASQVAAASRRGRDRQAHALQPVHQALDRQPAPASRAGRELRRDDHARGDGLAVQPGTVALGGLDRMAEGMAQIEDGARPPRARPRHDPGLGGAAALDGLASDVRVPGRAAPRAAPAASRRKRHRRSGRT
jgi:hypothetical protein